MSLKLNYLQFYGRIEADLILLPVIFGTESEQQLDGREKWLTHLDFPMLPIPECKLE